ncbi:MAG: pantetheine-phosphate adenylyltransferase [Alphaproteobacteria bacterium]|nr:pantetheine-phosphate adenylyltransferase [Alphaproteobacteria bacterium]
MKLKKGLCGIYPGTFDPITHGHMDIIRRSLKIVDHLIIGVASNDRKGPIFSSEERVSLVKEEIRIATDVDDSRIKVKDFGILLMHFAEQNNADILIRGLRAFTDFDYEFQMAGMNARLNTSIETVFLMASEQYQFISSRFVKEVCLLKGDISKFVSPHVEKELIRKMRTL